MTKHHEEFKNENITVSVDHQKGSHVKLNIVVHPKAVKAAYNKAIKLINKEVNLPGFRKGKAPDSFIEQNYGKQVEQEWKEVLLQTAFQEAINLVKVRPFRNESIKCSPVSNLVKDKEATFTIEFETPPQVPFIDLNEIVLKNIQRKPVAQEQIDEVILNLRLRHAKWNEVSDRAVQKEDYVDLDIERLDEPVENICKDTRFHITANQMAPWMSSLLIGKKVGESVEGVSEKDENRPAEEEFHPTRCQLTVKRILTPELLSDDDLAKKLGLKDFAELEAGVVSQLNQRRDQELQEDLRHQVEEALLEKYHFDLPKSLVEEEKNVRLQESLSHLSSQNLNKDELEKKSKELEKSIQTQVEKNFRLFFLILTFSQQHRIAVTKQEIDSAFSEQVMWQRRTLHAEELKSLQNRVQQQILMQKTKDYIIEHVKRQ